ncbi:MAG TPA: T9SS type A sorting domain-containing protein [Bacteroidia bacterium]|nr:T9SS type A sorting domain-containing protein [Bacteroidia bacterium]
MSIISNRIAIAVTLILFLMIQSSKAQTSFYGMRTRGGANDLGTIFKTDNSGNNFQKTHDFSAGYIGKRPIGELTEYAPGEFYGTTTKGGDYDKGTIFKYDLNNGTYNVIYHFGNNSAEGETPRTKLLKANNGKMYGIAVEGGANNDGVLFEIDINGNYTVKYSFSFVNGAYYDTLNVDYSYSVVQATDGNIYGTTITGGIYDGGVLYKFDGNGDNYVKLLDFNTSLVGGNGFNPMGSMVLTPNNKLYGTTYRGGNAANAGTIFSYDYIGNSYTVIHNFQDIPLDPKNPNGNLTYHNGKLWGSCPLGGTNNHGLLYSIDTTGGAFIDTYSFDSNTGSEPTGLMSFGNAQLGLDTLFGITHSGGDFGDGATFYYVPSNGNYTYFSFNDVVDANGNSTKSGIIQSSLDNHFYGLVERGGTLDEGTFIKCSTIGLEKVFDFNGPGDDGGKPQSSLLYASNGKLYGTTEFGGIYNKGIFFMTDLNTGTVTKLVDFDGNNGEQPRGGLVEHPNGKIYGTTYKGGLLTKGCIFEFDTATNTLTNVQDLSNTFGSSPTGTPIVGNNGYIIFTTSLEGGNGFGSLLKYDPINDLLFTLHNFSNTGNDGNFPMGGPYQAANGVIYGMTNSGGVSNYGTIYSYNLLNNTYTKLQDFLGNSNGRNPGLSTLEEINGRLIGTTEIGGSNNGGAVIDYNYNTNTLTAYSFTSSLVQGYKPFGVRKSDNGKFYGASQLAGANNYGTIFEFDPIGNTITGKHQFDDVQDGKDFGHILSLVGCDKPVITAQPQTIFTCPGSNVSFSLLTTGTGISYQWYKEGNLLAGQTASTLVFPNVAFSDTGNYHCTIINSCGTVISDFVKLNVQNVPTATTSAQGPSNNLCLDDNVTLIANITGTVLTYQWNFNGSPILGANAATYVADSVNASGSYTVTVSTGPGCDYTSTTPTNVGFLQFTYPSITVTASTDTICLSSSITFSTSVTDPGPIPFYQWYLNNNPISGQTAASFTSSTLQNNDIITVHFTSTATCVVPNLSTIITPDIIIVDTCLATPIISSSNILGAPFCAGTEMLVPFTTSANFNIGNVFTAELSDANGNFSNPINIGQLSGITSGVIFCTVPSVATTSSNYKVRVVANNPDTFSVGSNNIEIRSSNFGLDFTASSTNLTSQPASVYFNNNTPNQSNYNFNWYYGDGQMASNNSSSVLYTYGYNGIYDVALLAYDDAGCSDTLFKNDYITVNIPGAPSCNQTVTTNPNGNISACIGSLVPLNSNTNVTPIANAYYQWNRNGVPIGGASNPDYLVSMDGNYTVTVFNENACPITSSVVQVIFSQSAMPLPTISSTGTIGNCGNINLTLTASGGFTQYVWSNGQTSPSINVTQGGSYTVTGQSPNCDAVSLPFTVIGTSAPVPDICMITVDTINDINKNYIIWEKPVTNLIREFVIYREDTLASNSGIFHEIGRADYAADSSSFLDTTSFAKRRSYRYKLGVMDTCGGYAISSNAQRSMHLINVPGSSILQRYLHWNSYEGQPQGIDQYLIYRENLVSFAYELIDTVPSTQTWYIDYDLTSLNDTNRRYSVAYELTSGCDVTRAPRKGCVSNTSGHERITLGSGISKIQSSDYELNLFPNPTKGILYIQVGASNSITTKSYVTIRDIAGRIMNEKTLNTNQLNSIDMSNCAPGFYMVSVSQNNVIKTKKILIQK